EQIPSLPRLRRRSVWGPRPVRLWPAGARVVWIPTVIRGDRNRSLSNSIANKMLVLGNLRNQIVHWALMDASTVHGLEIAHVARNHFAHHPGHRFARWFQRTRRRTLLRDRVLRRRRSRPGAHHRADPGFARPHMKKNSAAMAGGCADGPRRAVRALRIAAGADVDRPAMPHEQASTQ